MFFIIDQNDYNKRNFHPSKIVQLTLSLFFASIGCTILLELRVRLTGSIQYKFLIWNLFLAWIPYFISLFIKYIALYIKKSKSLKFFIFLFSFIWLIFLPNATYIVTDFIYILKFPFYIPDKTFFTPNSLIWFDIVLSSSFAFIGHIIGLISILIMHILFNKIFNKPLGWTLIIISIILSGYGIFLGRFIRLNSWDIFHKPSLAVFHILSNLISVNAVLFSLGMGFFTFLTYIIIYFLYYLRK